MAAGLGTAWERGKPPLRLVVKKLERQSVNRQRLLGSRVGNIAAAQASHLQILCKLTVL